MAKLVITGIPVSSGVAVGKAFFVNRSLRTRLPRQTVEATRVKMEIDRFNQALDQTEADLKEIRERIPEEFNEHKFILDSHLNILRDPKLTQTAIKYMEDLNLNSEWAL